MPRSKRLPALSILTACVMLAGPAMAQTGLRACAGVIVQRAPAFEWKDELPEGGLQPVPANSEGCTLGHALRLRDGGAIWRCRIEIPEDTAQTEASGDPLPATRLLIVRPGQPVQVIKDDFIANRFDAFSVADVDLDGDGRREKVLSVWQSQGNGLGVNTWDVHVFDADWKRIATLPQVSEWGIPSIVSAPAGRRGCDLAVTEFLDGSEPPRGQGLYFTATFQRLSAGRLVPATDRPALHRRYTNALARQRARDNARSEYGDTSNVPAWLSGPGTRPGMPPGHTAPEGSQR